MAHRNPLGAPDLAYPVELTPDDNDTIMVTVPDVPGVTTYGEDKDDAVRHAVGALTAMLAGRIADREDIPLPSPAKGRPVVALPSLVASKVALYRAMREAGVRQTALAERMGVDPSQVRRLLDLTHASRHDQVDAALAALGKRLVVSVADAA